MEYDPLNRLVKIIQPNPQFLGDEGPITRQEYDLLGNVVKTIDPLGNATNYYYDNLNRKISDTNAEGGVTTFTYHEDGQMRSLTDPVGNTTSWTYNLLGRVSREMVTLDKKIRTRYFYYDVSGNITIKVDRNNRVTSWTYDKLNRPTSEVWHDTWRSFHENKQPIKKFTTTYNYSGKIASTEDGDNKFTFAYGIFGNEIKQTQNLADLEKPIEFNFVTNINGFNTEKIVKVDNKIDHTNKYEVDALNRISNISQAIENNISKSLKIQYDDLSQLVKQTRFDSGKEIIVTKNKYDLAGHLTNISHTGNNKTIYADYDLKWDNANRITDFDFTYLNGPEKRSESKYRYDKTSQLINASYNFMQHEKYDFDLNGNRKQAEIQGQKQSYKTGEYNRLLSDENYSYEYDLEGNRISKTDKEGKTTKYTWDNRNRLVKVSTSTSEIEYLYDYLNRLVKRTENKTDQQHFVHDNWQIILQFDNKEPNPTHRYLWGTKQDELICDNNNWTLGDHLNTIRDIVKSDGTVSDHLNYNSFGKLISETKNDILSFAYTGKLLDQTSDLQWNINRWYDSNVGRWMSEDPIGFKGNSINVYCYVKNRIMIYMDVYGLVDDFFEITIPPNGEKCQFNCATPPPPDDDSKNDNKICEKKYILPAQGDKGKKCDDIMKQAMNNDNVKKLINKIKTFDNKFTIQISCKKCCGPCNGAGAWHFSSTTPAIYICQDQEFDVNKMVNYLLHELTHELQRVRGTPHSTCLDNLKMEVEAYATKPGSSFIDVYKSATWSACYIRKCTKNDIIANVNILYEFWKNLSN
jgi:RHS repeat-associated protein